MILELYIMWMADAIATGHGDSLSCSSILTTFQLLMHANELKHQGLRYVETTREYRVG